MFKRFSQLGLRLLPTPLAFFEMEWKVPLDPVELGQPSLGEAPERFDAVDVDTLTFGKLILTVVDSIVAIVANVNETVITPPAVGVNDRISRNTAQNQGLEGGFLAVGHNLSEDSASPLKDAEDRLFLGAAATFQFAMEATNTFGAKVRLVHFRFTDYLFHLLALIPVDGEAASAKEAVGGFAVDTDERGRSRRINVEAKALKQLGHFASTDSGLLYQAHLTILP